MTNKQKGKTKNSGFPESCAETQNRTVDTTIFSRMLYQLSYLGEPLFLNNGFYYTAFLFCVKTFANIVTRFFV